MSVERLLLLWLDGELEDDFDEELDAAFLLGTVRPQALTPRGSWGAVEYLERMLERGVGNENARPSLLRQLEEFTQCSEQWVTDLAMIYLCHVEPTMTHVERIADVLGDPCGAAHAAAFTLVRMLMKSDESDRRKVGAAIMERALQRAPGLDVNEF